MAMIYSDLFLDPKTGIARFNSLLSTLNREFQPRQAELQGLQTRINTLTKEIEDTQSVADPNAIRQKRDQLTQVSTEFKRKGEDAEAAYTKRRQEIFLPLQQDIGKALEAFAKARGFENIFLAGHSLGTPIVEYYQGDNPDPSVKAVGVYGPHIDIPSVTKESLLGADLYEKFAAECRSLVASGKGDEIKLLPFRGRKSDHHFRQNISQLPRRRDQQSRGGTDDYAYQGPAVDCL